MSDLTAGINVIADLADREESRRKRAAKEVAQRESICDQVMSLRIEKAMRGVVQPVMEDAARVFRSKGMEAYVEERLSWESFNPMFEANRTIVSMSFGLVVKLKRDTREWHLRCRANRREYMASMLRNNGESDYHAPTMSWLSILHIEKGLIELHVEGFAEWLFDEAKP